MDRIKIRRRNLLKIKRTGLLLVLITFSFAFSSIMAEEKVNLLRNASWEYRKIIYGAKPPWQTTFPIVIGKGDEIEVRISFNVSNISKFVCLELKDSRDAEDFTLNGKSIPLPLKGMKYRTIPAIPTSILNRGKNVLIRHCKFTNKNALLGTKLYGLSDRALYFQTGPVLGCAGDNYFTVTCRTNMVASVTLHTDKRKLASGPSIIHRFEVKNLKSDTEYAYFLTASIAGSKFEVRTEERKVRTLVKSGKFSFVAIGDSRTNPKEWAKVAKAIIRNSPRVSFSVFSGDMVTNGLQDYQWDAQFFNPAKDFFGTIPVFAVIGNHEFDCPLFTKIFMVPGGEKNWTQEIGNVLFIGIDGAMDWSKGSSLFQWLEKLLSGSKSKFIFLFSHYPAWSSAIHGRIDMGTGMPVETTVRRARETIMPLLKNYNATAMVAGHDHCYERSEPEDGVTMIISAGAGGPLYSMVGNAKKQNPYSKVFASKYHYSVFTVDKNSCIMEAISLAGEVIDTKIWEGR